MLNKELPPRTRRIPRRARRATHTEGTTSAYAENTLRLLMMLPVSRNYLRVRGEYPEFHRWGGAQWELPPRTRRIRPTVYQTPNHLGTTSAYAENT